MAGGIRATQLSRADSRTLEHMLDATAVLLRLTEDLERALGEAREALGHQRRANGSFVRERCQSDTLADLDDALSLVADSEKPGDLFAGVLAAAIDAAGKGAW